MHKLGDSGNLIIPVTQIAFGEIILGHIRMYAKQEQHITVFNYPVGRLIMQAYRSSTDVLNDIEEIVNNTDWSFHRTSNYYLLERGRDVGELYTIAELLHVPAMDEFYKMVARIVPRDAQDLIEMLLREPAPHVTLYTSDHEGRAGIGINSLSELIHSVKGTSASIDKTGKIRAYALPRRILEGVVIEVG